MTDGTWCPKHLRTIGALVPCSLCEEERKGPKRYRVSYDNGIIEEDGSPRRCLDSEPMVLAADYDALLATVSALEKEVEDRSRGYNELYDLWIAEQKRASQLRADAERYRWLRDQRRWLYNLPPTPGISVRWENYIAGPSDWLDSAIDAQLAAMRTGEGA